MFSSRSIVALFACDRRAKARRLHVVAADQQVADDISTPVLRVAIVAPTLSILGGQAVQAQRLLDGWRDDREVRAFLVPINPEPPSWLRPLMRIKYVRTLITQLIYLPVLVQSIARADVVHVFSAVVLVVSVGATACDPREPAVGPSGGRELSKRRGAGPSAPFRSRQARPTRG